jgi:ABC-type oligopeptide transport system substrate-binding subunit
MTSERSWLGAAAQIVKTDVAAIDLRVAVDAFPVATPFAELATSGAPFDIGWVAWMADYPDPDNFLNLLLEAPSDPSRVH